MLGLETQESRRGSRLLAVGAAIAIGTSGLADGRATAQSAPATIDLFDYVIPACAGPSPVRAGERRTIPIVDPRFEQPSDPKLRRGHVYYLKSADGTGFEEWAVDAYYIYILTDTTWARGFMSGDQASCDQNNSCTGAADCDFVCGTTQCARRWRCRDVPPGSWEAFDDTRGICAATQPGGGTQWAFTRYYCTNHADHGQEAPCTEGVLGAHWLRRHVADGDDFSTHFRVKAAGQQDCGEGCSAIQPPPPGHSVEGAASHRVIPYFRQSWTAPDGTVFGPVSTDVDGDGVPETLPGVVEIYIAEGAGGGERYWYARGFGLVASQRGSEPIAYYSPSNATIPSTPGQIHDCNQAGAAFSPDTTQLCAARAAGQIGAPPPEVHPLCAGLDPAVPTCTKDRLAICEAGQPRLAEHGCVPQAPGEDDFEAPDPADPGVCTAGTVTPPVGEGRPSGPQWSAARLPNGFALRLPFAPQEQVKLLKSYGTRHGPNFWVKNPGANTSHCQGDAACLACSPAYCDPIEGNCPHCVHTVLHKRVAEASVSDDYYALDLALAKTSNGKGSPVVAAGGGDADCGGGQGSSCASVVAAGWASGGGRSFGQVVVLKHAHPASGRTFYSLYAHLDSVSVSVGAGVKKGDEIGKLGASGCDAAGNCSLSYWSAPHLHFALYEETAENAVVLSGGVAYGGRAVVPEPIDGYACLAPRTGGAPMVAGDEGGTVHTQPVAITQSTTFRAGDVYQVRSTSTSLIASPGVLSSPTQGSTALFPVAAVEISGRSNLTLDCNGVWIQSSSGDLTADRSNDRLYGGVGIRVRNSSNVVVRNCNVAGYRYGILVEDSTNVTVEGNRSTHNYRKFSAGFFMDSAAIPSEHFGGGIRVWRGSRVRVVDNQGDNQMSGIELIATNDSEVTGNRFNYDQVGLYLGRSSRNRVEGNDFDWAIRFETRTWTNGSAQTLEKGGVFDFMDRGLLRVQEDGTVNGLPVRRILRLMDRDTGRPFWDLATMTLDSAGVLIENASHANEIRGNSLNYGGDGLFIRANQTPCSTGNVIVDNEAAYSPNNGLELSFCDGRFENNLVHSNQHGMWLGAGAHDVVLKGNRFANNLTYAVLGTRNGPVTFEGNTVSDTPVAVAMQAERWPGNMNLPADGAVVRTRDWTVQGNTFRGIRGGAFPWMLLGANDAAVFRLSGVERFNARSNTYAGSDRCSLPHPSPAPGTPPNVAMTLDCVAAGDTPVALFTSPADGASLQGGTHHNFLCRGTDDKALQSIEILFNNEHRARCNYTQAEAAKSKDCRFDNFYVGADLNGRTLPMDCHVTDWTAKTGTHHISVTVGTADPPPHVQFTSPKNGQTVATGHNNFTCTATDNKNLAWIEILFNNEHRHRCSYGPVTSGNCTFANFYVGPDMSGRTVPMRCTAADLAGGQNRQDISVTIGAAGGDAAPPGAQFLAPTSGATLQGGAHHNFLCRGTDDKALQSIEIVFNNEHRSKCNYTEAEAAKSKECRFDNFYVGADMNGRTIPMSCRAIDWAGRIGTQYISVQVGASDAQAPYVQLTSPTNGQKVPPGHNNFACYASDNKSLASIEILFNNEHRHRCSFGPVTSGTCTFSNFYVGSDMLGRTVPIRCTAADLAGNQSRHDISVTIGSDDAAPPAAQFVSPTNGATLQSGAHHDFLCHGSDDKALQSLEIVFNNEHRSKCDYSQAEAARSRDCRFDDFYVGSSLEGRTISMYCRATDWAGRVGTQYINVQIAASDAQAPYVQLTSPANGQRVPPGHNNFSCYASDNKNLAWIEILFNNEHRHRCSFGPATSGSCTFSNFYVGADMLGRTVPMRCTAADLAGNQARHDINVTIGN